MHGKNLQELSPGNHIEQILSEKGWSQADFAERMGYTKKHIHLLLSGKVPLSEDAALKLELVLGETMSYWLNLEIKYRESLNHNSTDFNENEVKTWLKNLPIRDMIQFGWIQKHKDIKKQSIEIFKYFGVASLDAWQRKYGEQILAFRKTDKFEANVASISAWIRYGEQVAEKKAIAPYNEHTLKSKITDIRGLCTQIETDEFIPKLKSLLGECGIVMVIAPNPKKCPVSGVSKWISPSKALIMLSFRYSSNDHFWFTLFHEIGHILLHKKKMTYMEYRSLDIDASEKEANKFASETLIPTSFDDKIQNVLLKKDSIGQLADEIGIASGILVGRLQKEGIVKWATDLNSLKVYYKWRV